MVLFPHAEIGPDSQKSADFWQKSRESGKNLIGRRASGAAFHPHERGAGGTGVNWDMTGKKLMDKSRRNGGFTLLEVPLTAAILVGLLGRSDCGPGLLPARPL